MKWKKNCLIPLLRKKRKANNEDFDLSDISHSKSIDREAIIAAAEAEDFEN